jgi:hypothetical protein
MQATKRKGAPRRLAFLAPWQRARRDHERARALLDDLEPAGFRCLHRVDTGYGDVDHVVVGPTGAFAIETTHWTGVVRTRRDRLICGFRDEEKARRRAVWNAACLEQWLEEDGVDMPVTALLVPIEARVEGGWIELPSLTVLPLESLPAFLRDGAAALTEAQIACALDGIDQRARSFERPAPPAPQTRTAST